MNERQSQECPRTAVFPERFHPCRLAPRGQVLTIQSKHPFRPKCEPDTDDDVGPEQRNQRTDERHWMSVHQTSSKEYQRHKPDTERCDDRKHQSEVTPDTGAFDV